MPLVGFWGKKSGKTDSASANKANVAEEGKKNRGRDAVICPHPNKKSKAQPAASAPHEAAGVDEDGFAYSAVFLPFSW